MRAAIVLFCLVVAMPSAAQLAVQEEFTPPELNWDVWCPCLINMKKAPMAFLPDADPANDYFAQIVVDESSLGGNVCRRGAPHHECRKPSSIEAADVASASIGLDDPEDLGPSFIEGLPSITRANIYCTPEVMKRAMAAGEEDECIQRQEIQFQKALLHRADVPYLYSFRFRMPGEVEDRNNSIRWVIAQWKQDAVSNKYTKEFGKGWGPSPFLAQRFDDGVLHITVQDEHCRCVVASAPRVKGSFRPWSEGSPQECLSTRPGDPEETECPSDLELEYGDDPELSSPTDNWVEMRYRVQAGRAAPSVIEVYEKDRFIVRVTGKIGYEPNPAEAARTRFKIGQYRDYMPTIDAMDIDWIKREKLAN